jgi:hypothetical protein
MNRLDRPVFQFFPVPRRFFLFFTGSCAERFCGRLGPDAGPVSGPTGRTGRSGLVFTTLLLLSSSTKWWFRINLWSKITPLNRFIFSHLNKWFSHIFNFFFVIPSSYSVTLCCSPSWYDTFVFPSCAVFVRFKLSDSIRYIFNQWFWRHQRCRFGNMSISDTLISSYL